MSEEKKTSPKKAKVPHDVVNEQVVLASALADHDTAKRLVRELQADLFQVPDHHGAWVGLSEIIRRKLRYDPATMKQIAGESVDLKYLVKLAGMRPEVSENLDHHIEALKWDAARAAAVKGPIAALHEALENPREAPDRVRALAHQVGGCFDGYIDRSYTRDSKALVQEQMAKIRARTGGSVHLYGIDGLDFYEAEDGAAPERRLIPGPSPGTMTVVTGVSGGGKSTVTASIVLGLARQKKRVKVGAWEMSPGTYLELLATISLEWERSSLIGGVTGDKDTQLERRMTQISKWVTFMENPFGRTRIAGKKPSNDRNLDIIEQEIDNSGCDIFVADLWERCLVDSDHVGDVTQALFRMQAMVEQRKVHAILVQQQKLKELEQQVDKRPRRDLIKGTSAWVDVADTILGVHCPALWKNIENDRLEVLVLKQRYGKWPLCVEFEWDPVFGTIRGGKSVNYEQPGEQGGSIDDLFTSSKGKKGAKKGGRSKAPKDD